MPYYAGVGSRNAPNDILSLMYRLGKTLCDQGWGLSSGNAPGADINFYLGAMCSGNFSTVPSRIYLPWEGFNGSVQSESVWIYDATRFEDTYQEARRIAYKARGGFEGLSRGGIALHTRNTFQILGDTLTEPVRAMIYWAEPFGKQERVKGGTNTALQIAINYNVPTRLNLYFDEDRRRAEDFLERYEEPCIFC